LTVSAPISIVSAPTSTVSAPHANHTSSNMKNYCLFRHQISPFRHQFCATRMEVFLDNNHVIKSLDLFMSIYYPRYCTVRPLGAL
jgi:hypothetical protein